MPKHKGGALLTSLFIMTLVAIIATAMSLRLQSDIYRTQSLVSHDKLYLAAQAVTFWSMSEIIKSPTWIADSNTFGLVKEFPVQLKKMYPQFKISGKLYDLQARFNLNNLSDKKYIIQYISLLNSAYPKANTKLKMDLTVALLNWIVPYNQNAGKDAFVEYYASKKPPYYPAHQMMLSQSELLLVKNYNATIYTLLQPLITALPTITPININTAPAIVIRSLGSSIDKKKAQELIDARGKKGFQKMDKLNAILKKMNVEHVELVLRSDYFLSIAEVINGEQHLNLYSLLKKTEDKEHKISVQIVRESFNVM